MKAPHTDSSIHELNPHSNAAQHIRKIARELQDLLYHAYILDIVITVELKPCEPLAMGNYCMVGNVRGAR